MMIKAIQLVMVLMVWLTTLSLLATTETTTITVSALGQSNIFGVFRKRRRSLEGIQDRRVQVASRKGFAGPHGELLTISEYEDLQAERRAAENNGDKDSNSGKRNNVKSSKDDDNGGILETIREQLGRKTHRRSKA